MYQENTRNVRKLQNMLKGYYYYLEHLSLHYYQKEKFIEAKTVDRMLLKFEEFFKTQEMS